MGQSPPSSTYNSDGDGLPFFQGAADFGDMYPRPRVYCSDPARIAEKGDILISVRAPVGPTNRAPARSCIGRGVAALRPRPKLDAPYLLYFLRHQEGRLARLGQGSTFDAIGRDDIEEYPIPLPDLPVQRRIAGILDQADRLRRMRRYALELSDQFLPALFLRMFGDPATNPMRWPTKPLRKMCAKFSDGPFGSDLKTSHYSASGVRVVRLQNIGVGRFLDDDRAFISDSHFRTIRQHECLAGDVVIGTLGDPNLRACVLPRGLGAAMNKADCVQARVDPVEATPEFVCWLMNVPEILTLAFGLVHGQTRSRVSMGQLSAFRVPAPPLDLQRVFSRAVVQFELEQTALRESLRQAEHLFQSLLNRYFGKEN